MSYSIVVKMNNILNYFLLCSVLLFDVKAFDIYTNNGIQKSVYMDSADKQKSGSCLLFRIQSICKQNLCSNASAFGISCQHILTGATYDFFGDRHASTSFVCGCALRDELFEHFYRVCAERYKKLIIASYSSGSINVNLTSNSDQMTLSTPFNHSTKNTYVECLDKYLTFCEQNIELPIDISVLFAKNIDTSCAKIYDLPTNDQISSWKNKTIKVTIYGYPASKNSEHSVTCDMRLTNCGNWFKSLEPIPQGFLDLHGMSGGPGFTEEEVLCGVISGCDNDRRLCVRALTTDLVEAIKFGVEKMLDK